MGKTDSQRTRPGSDRPTLSVIIPVYNEKSTLPEVLERVLQVPVDKEIVVVDDGSTDGTTELLNQISKMGVTVLRHETNRGKGAAVQTALPYVRGKYIITQDADLEYDPTDYLALLRAVDNSEGVVYGSRILNPNNKPSYMRYRLGGIALSKLANVLYGLQISDLPTGYKLFKSDLIKSVRLTCTKFDFCAEITAKLGRMNIKIREVPIAYSPRTFQQGKKIRWTDGIKAAWTLITFRLVE